MSNRNFIIRKATIQDVNKLTELHCLSFKPKDHVPVLLGRRYVRATYVWMVTSDMSYVLVAEAEARIVGSVAVADRSFAKPMFKACLADFFFSILRNPRLLFERSLWKRLFRQAEASPQGHKIVNHPGLAQMTIGAVDSSFRGQGIFGELVKATTVYSHARGSRAVRAGVYKPNSSSRRVFEKCGWIETPTLETADTVNYIFYIDSSFREELGLIDQE